MNYRKLTSRRRSLLGYSQLWLGDGHLLLVRSARLVENYQRFALEDIQAIVISDGPDLRAIQALAVMAALGWMALALAMSSTFGQGFFLITGSIGLTFAIIDIWRGPRCRCVLHTAVSKEPLPPVSRRNASWKFLAAVLPAIEAVQGPIALEQLQAASSHPQPGTEASQPQPPEVTHTRSYLGELLFGLVLLDAALVWVVLRTSVPNTVGLLPTVYLAELVMAGVMLAQRHATSAALLIWGTLTLALVVADVTTVSGMAGFAAFMNTTDPASHRELKSLWLSPRATAIFASSWRVAAGAIGLGLCALDRRRTRRENPA
jgi:hypothetical protein